MMCWVVHLIFQVTLSLVLPTWKVVLFFRLINFYSRGNVQQLCCINLHCWCRSITSIAANSNHGRNLVDIQVLVHCKQILPSFDVKVDTKRKITSEIEAPACSWTSSTCTTGDKPSKKAIEIFAGRTVNVFPCLLEEIDGCTVGTGYDGWATKLSRRFKNESRKKFKDVEVVVVQVNE